MSTRYFFIVGTPRSGTTLLQSLIMQSPGVTVPPETQFFDVVYAQERVLGPIGSDSGWDNAVQVVINRNNQNEFPADGHELSERLSRPGPRTHARLLSDWLDLCGESNNATIIGEKSPSHAHHVGLILSMFESARIIQIVRDPRDVAISHHELWNRTHLQAAVRWRLDQQQAIRHAKSSYADRFRLVKYEDLIEKPEQTMRGLAEFLDIEFVPNMTDPSQRQDTGFASREKHKLQTLEKLTSSRIGRYRGKLSRREISIVQAFCAPQMTKLGYELEPGSRLIGALEAIAEAPRTLRNKVTSRRLERSKLNALLAERAAATDRDP